MSSIDQQFVEFVVKSLVGNPDAVKIDRRVDEKGVLLELTVDPEDLGRVIGKRGATAQSLRTLLRALGTKNEARYNLKIVDNGPAPENRARPTSDEPVEDTPKKESKKTDKPAPAYEDDLSDDEAEAAAQKVEDAADDDASDEDKSQDSSDRLAQTRAELADLDDLDI